jgi:hypothetical protein
VRRPSPELVESGVAQQVFSGGAGECDGKRRLFDDRPQCRFALPQRRLRPPALGDVLEHDTEPPALLAADAEHRRVEPLAIEAGDHVFEFHGFASHGDTSVLIEPELLQVRDELLDPLADHRLRGLADERGIGLQIPEVDGTAVFTENDLDDAVRVDHRIRELAVPSLALA